jgi:hypothetical protein
LTSSLSSPEGCRLERYENEVVPELFGTTTRADSGGGPALETGGTGAEAAPVGVPESASIKTTTTANAAMTIPVIAQTSVRPRGMA